LGKIPENLGKTSEKLCKISENPGKNGARCCLTSENAAQHLQKSTIKTFVFEVTPKTGLHFLCGRKFVGNRCTKAFRASLGKFGQNPSHPQKFACSYT